jgi:hypothetical protein
MKDHTICTHTHTTLRNDTHTRTTTHLEQFLVSLQAIKVSLFLFWYTHCSVWRRVCCWLKTRVARRQFGAYAINFTLLHSMNGHAYIKWVFRCTTHTRTHTLKYTHGNDTICCHIYSYTHTYTYRRLSLLIQKTRTFLQYAIESACFDGPTCTQQARVAGPSLYCVPGVIDGLRQESIWVCVCMCVVCVCECWYMCDVCLCTHSFKHHSLLVSLSLTHTRSPSLPNTHTHTHTISLPNTYTLSLTHKHTHTLYFALTHIHTLYLSLSHTHIPLQE